MGVTFATAIVEYLLGTVLSPPLPPPPPPPPPPEKVEEDSKGDGSAVAAAAGMDRGLFELVRKLSMTAAGERSSFLTRRGRIVDPEDSR